jgi:hypothetical protein
MKTYSIKLTRCIYEEAFVTVKADDEEQAEILALEGPLSWHATGWDRNEEVDIEIEEEG